MDDLENYRRRIRTFNSCHHSVSKFNGLHLGKDTKRFFTFKIMFLIYFSLVILCTTRDLSIAKNRGPSTRNYTGFPYTTTEEKTVFIKLCRLSEEKIDLKSHNLFLQNCLNNSVIPKGLLPSFSSAVDKLHENLNYKLEFLDQNNSFNKMIVIISHYQNLLVNMDEEIEKVKGQISDISSTNRYRCLLGTLEGFNKKHARKVNFIKKKKLKKLTKQRHTPDKNHPKSTDSNSWIPELSLTNTEKNFILNGEYICDQIIDSSMMLIHQQKPCFIFQSTSFNHNLLQYCPYQVINICHDGTHILLPQQTRLMAVLNCMTV